MAVHKLSAEEVAKVEPVRVLVTSEDEHKRSQRQYTIIKLEEKNLDK